MNQSPEAPPEIQGGAALIQEEDIERAEPPPNKSGGVRITFKDVKYEVKVK